jgi:anti-sigma regulatory factor (Ser/Thr protein kinase)
MLAPAQLMPRDLGEHPRYRVELATDLSRVGEVVDTVCACCFATVPPTPRTQFRLCTVVAEAVANAMVYGNGSDPARRVIIEVELDDDQMVIAVSDEGDGFDHNTVPLPIGDESRDATRGRGLFMIHRLADHVVFNDRGNTIWMTLPRR